jgi:hypothetical protein
MEWAASLTVQLRTALIDADATNTRALRANTPTVDAAMDANRTAAAAGEPAAGLAAAPEGGQPPHPQRDPILAQCQTLSQEAHSKINEAGEGNPMEIEAGLQMILQTVQMVSQLGDQNLMGQWISLQIKTLQRNGNQQAAMALQGALKQMFQPR